MKIPGDNEVLFEGEVVFEREACSAHLLDLKDSQTLMIVDDAKKVCFPTPGLPLELTFRQSLGAFLS